MDLSFSKEEMAFRDEVRAFFRTTCRRRRGRNCRRAVISPRTRWSTWWRILNKKGWGVSHWPKEYGGTGWSSVQHYIFNEELQMRRRRRRSPSASAWSAR